MDRKTCVLFYSQYSSASKSVMERIQTLPYDLPKVTGLTLMCIDAEAVKKVLMNRNITVVPCLYVEYHDGEIQMLTDDLIGHWIDEVSEAIKHKSTEQAIEVDKTSSPSPPDTSTSPPTTTVSYPAITDRHNVMSSALSMQKMREQEDGNKPKFK